MGSKPTVILAALIATGAQAQDTGNLLVNPGFQQGLAGWSSSGPGGTYNGCGPAGGVCYVFSYSTGNVSQTVTTEQTYTDYLVSFQYRLPCNNSIGGYCENPNGPKDWLTAAIQLYSAGQMVDSDTLLSVSGYSTSYTTFSATGSLAAGFDSAKLSFTGQDVGYWAGPYGPQIDNVSLSFSGTVAETEEPPAAPVIVTPTVEEPVAQVAVVEAEVEAVDVEQDVASEAIPVAELVEAVQETVEDTVEVAVADEAVEAEVAEEDEAAERLTPDQLFALVMADAQSEESAAEEQVFAAQSFETESAQQTFSPVFSASASSATAQEFTTSAQTSLDPTNPMSPQNLAQSMELPPATSMAPVLAPVAADVGAIAPGQNEVMADLTTPPAGFSQYAQARVPDVPFYAPRDIYKNRRLQDANMAMYRLLRGQDSRWQEMTEDQYE